MIIMKCLLKILALINIWQEVEGLNMTSSRQCWAPELTEANCSNKTNTADLPDLSLTAALAIINTKTILLFYRGYILGKLSIKQ